MQALYSIIYTLLLPFIVLRLWIRGKKAPLYRKRWNERFGQYEDEAGSERPLWIHAVSVGEVMAASILVEKIWESNPSQCLYITTTTPTGSERVRQLWGSRVRHSYLPYDLTWLLKPLVKGIRPIGLVIIETELWPNLLKVCRELDVNVSLVNARLSQKSADGYAKIPSLTRAMLNNLACILVQNEADAERFITLGAHRDNVQVTGSIKYDRAIPEKDVERGRALKASWVGEHILIAASTHAGEDKVILEAFEKIRAAHPHFRLIIVPRHPERFDEVFALSKQFNSNVQRRSEGHFAQTPWDILIGDSMGEMFFYFSLADSAFMGGSLVPVGGHNMLEPAALGLPVITGPYLHNFKDISESMTRANALRVVNNADELTAAVKELLNDQEVYDSMSQAAITEVEKNKGALQKTVSLLRNYAILG